MFRLACIVVLTLVLATASLAQTGHWESHANDIGGLGSTLHAAGDRAAGVTQEISQRLLFFDTLNGQWVAHDLAEQHTWQLLAAEGDLVLVVADGVAVAYNGLTATAHELALSGDLLRNDSNHQSFACGARLAYVATDEMLYVFDAELDDWQGSSITLPGGYNTCLSAVSADWVGLSLIPTSYGAAAPCHAYSLPHHQFAETGNGPVWGPTSGALDHGFAWSNHAEINQRLVGYSAINNTFTYSTVNDDHGDITAGVSDPVGKALRTVYAAVYDIPGAVDREHHFHAFDTRQGSWVHDVREWEPAFSYPWDNLIVGGQFAVTCHEINPGLLEYRIYRGADGTVQEYEPELGITGINHMAGGSTFVVFDLDWYAWGLNTVTGDSSRVELENIYSPSLKTSGEDFGLFGLTDDENEIMEVFAYNGVANEWTTRTVGQQYSVHDFSGSHCFITTVTDVDIDVVFYSGHHGVLQGLDFPLGPYPYFGYSDHLAALRTTGGDGCLYDASRERLFEHDYDFVREGIGQCMFVGADTGALTAWGYSSLSGIWTSVGLDETPRLGESRTYLGWVADPAPSRHYQVFNALHDSWTPLDLTANASGESLGERTMVVVTSSNLHAFDPDGPITALEDDDLVADEETPRVALAPATPNPFNPRTSINYSLEQAQDAVVRVYDLAGRCVAELASGPHTAGSHQVLWNGADQQGHALASGAYLVRLETEQAVRTQKISLVR